MQATEMSTATNERLKIIFDDLVGSLRQLIIKHRITEAEYMAAIELVSEMGRIGYEIPLCGALFLEVTVDNVTYEHYAQMGGTSSNILGPYYIEGAPVLSSP